MLSKKQKIIKGTIYESLMFLLALGVIWIWTGNFGDSLRINILITIIKMCCYYGNEHLWEKISG